MSGIRGIAGRAGAFLTSVAKTVIGFFDATDVFVFLGLALLGYGLHHRWGLWLACVVCGAAMCMIGLIMLMLESKRAKA